jgi:hypothetical protein
MPVPFRQHMDVLSKSPAPAHRHAAHGEDMDVRVEAMQEQLPDGRQAGWPFSLAIFLFTPGFLPFALRASFAVRARILRARGHTKRK